MCLFISLSLITLLIQSVSFAVKKWILIVLKKRYVLKRFDIPSLLIIFRSRELWINKNLWPRNTRPLSGRYASDIYYFGSHETSEYVDGRRTEWRRLCRQNFCRPIVDAPPRTSVSFWAPWPKFSWYIHLSSDKSRVVGLDRAARILTEILGKERGMNGAIHWKLTENCLDGHGSIKHGN